MKKPPNWSLLTALALPVIMILAVVLSIYLPSKFQRYEGQFLYSIQEGSSYWGAAPYIVIDGRLQEGPALTVTVAGLPGAVQPSSGTFRLYVHDIAANESRDISLQEAKALTLDGASKSSHQIEIGHGTRGDHFLFLPFGGGMDYSTVYAIGSRGSRKLNVRMTSNGYYYRQFQFIGWVKS